MIQSEPRIRLLLYVYRTGVLPTDFVRGRLAREANVDVNSIDEYLGDCVRDRWLSLDGGAYWVTAAGRRMLGMR